MASLSNLIVQKGSTILITGVNDFLGLHIADQFLEHGYKKYGEGHFELFKIADLTAEGAFEKAAKGTSVIVHTASITKFSADLNAVIPQAIAFARNALESAYKEASVKRFVLTSSSSAAILSVLGGPGIKVTEGCWNEFAIKAAWADTPYTQERGGIVYAVSKTEDEQTVWKYHKENRNRRPDLVINAVLPSFNFGKSLDSVNQGHPSSSALPAALWQGEVIPFHHVISHWFPEYYIDVQDTGRLHVAAAVFDHVKDRRTFSFAERFSWDNVLDILRKTAPNKEFPNNFSAGSDPNDIKPRDEAEQLLRDLGRPGWVSLEDSILANF
ncbi:Aldehyde reductase 2 [Fusarium oxysporum f. sp. cubense]|uniref:Aldehyde reductase 2 n=1 Tax=Fusarium oxysporum f. sp. cubense TaxID=61366 RepID=A0A559LTN7_FUSOC|nr:Aldehyde reductase 2 [Fusarium oxysporum f. sp. cubense]